MPATSQAQTYALTTLATFSGTNGSSPTGVTFDGNGNLYGATSVGGTSGYGTVFEVAAGSNTITTLDTFDNTNGAYPLSSVTFDSRGDFYGTTYGTGVGSYGTVYEIAAGTNTLTTIATFNSATGVYPIGGLTLDSAGNLYGTTTFDGPNDGDGTVFEISAATHALTVLATFDVSDGGSPQGNLAIDSSGNLYGTAEYAGTNSAGTVFEIAAGSHSITTLAAFNDADGAYPQAGVTLDKFGNLYGTTASNGPGNYGTVFKIAAGTNVITTLAAFNVNGESTFSGVTLDSSGNIYGTTPGNGSDSNGTVFKIAAGSNVLTTIATFDSANGSAPTGNLTLDSNGNIYGTTSGGGTNNDGTVFKLSLSSSGAAPEPAALALLTPILIPFGLNAAQRCRNKHQSA